MYLKNISGSQLIIGGSLFNIDAQKPLTSIGSRETIRGYAEQILQEISNNNLEVVYPDGDTEDRLTIIHNLLMNGFIGVELNKPEKNYYFLRDTFKLKKDEFVEKVFIGKVRSIQLTPQSNAIDIVMITHQGLELPANKVTKNQTIEFNFEEGLLNPTIRLSTPATTEIDIFIEGYDESCENYLLQRFIKTWYQDVSLWTTTKPTLCFCKFNYKIHQKPTLIEDDVNGHTLRVYDNRNPDVNQEYKIYKERTNSYVVEFITDSKWNPFDENRYHVRSTNISFIQFDDQTVDLSVETLVDYITHESDKLED